MAVAGGLGRAGDGAVAARGLRGHSVRVVAIRWLGGKGGHVTGGERQPLWDGAMKKHARMHTRTAGGSKIQQFPYLRRCIPPGISAPNKLNNEELCGLHTSNGDFKPNTFG